MRIYKSSTKKEMYEFIKLNGLSTKGTSNLRKAELYKNIEKQLKDTYISISLYDIVKLKNKGDKLYKVIRARGKRPLVIDLETKDEYTISKSMVIEVINNLKI